MNRPYSLASIDSGALRREASLMKHTWLRLALFTLAFAVATPALADEAHVYYEQGLALKRQGKTAEAIEKVKLAIDARPKYAAAWFTLGNLYRSEGQYGQALPAYQKAASLQPANADIQAN